MPKIKTLTAEIPYEERVDHLADEVKAIRSQSGVNAYMAVLDGRHQIGEAIVKHQDYEKGKTGRQLIRDVIKRIGGSESELYLCVKFFEKYPKVSLIVESLPGDVKPNWASVRKLLEGKNPRHVHKLKKVEVWECEECGALLRNKP